MKLEKFLAKSIRPWGLKLLLLLNFAFIEQAFAWTEMRDFNNGILGQKAQGADGFSSDAGDSIYANSQVSEGANSAKLSIDQGATAYGRWGGVIGFPELVKGNEIWVSLDIYVPSDFDTSTNTGVLKFLRLRQKNGDGSHTGYLDMLIDNVQGAFRILKEGPNVPHLSFGTRPDDSLKRDRWVNVEMYAYLDEVSVADGGKAFVRYYIDGKRYDFTTIRTIDNSEVSVYGLYLFTYWNGGAPKNQSLYVDNIIITSDRPAVIDTLGDPVIGNWLNTKAPRPPSSFQVSLPNLP